jgi:(1->4)-alpha-D-glucan 1-alpha-D-glucosylmutase
MSPAERDRARKAVRVPRSTYRLQLRPDFGFAAVVDAAPALARLGITDLYLSPCFQAAPGSPHGYDLVDHNRLNEDFGGETGWAALRSALARLGMGMVLDFVPNHMGVDDPRANAWWWDVLENGNCSPYSSYFDVDWDPVKAELRGKVLLPVLGDQYGRVLERGELQLEYVEGTLHLRYFERAFPVNPRRIPVVLRRGIEALEVRLGADDPDLREFLSVLTALDNLPSVLETDRARVAERQREKVVARERLHRLAGRSRSVLEHIERCVRECNGTPGDFASVMPLHELLELQPYRLAYWRTAFHEINYRRFFDVNALASVRMEDPEVFESAHPLLFRLIREGGVTGVRLDHIDGLFDPGVYLRRFSRGVRAALGGAGGEPAAGPPVYVVVEKILAPGERLPASWAVHGTTGYDFLNEVNGLFVDPRGQRPLLRLFERFTHRRGRFEDVVYESKKMVMESAMAGELNMLARALNIISEDDPSTRDFTLNSLRETLLEMVACFPVYRTYVADDFGHDDAQAIRAATARALDRNPTDDASVFEFFEEVALGRLRDGQPEASSERRHAFALKLQQYTAPVHARGVEDTAFYRYHPLLSLCEVGGSPQRFGVSVSEFHASNQRRSEHWPCAMLCTSTHDTKRGEDARARLDVLSEIPDEWRRMVSRWARVNGTNRTRVEHEFAPDRGDEYLFYQALLGAWPPGKVDLVALATRLRAYMIKAIREAKLHTSWVQEHPAYEQAMAQFVDQCLRGRRSGAFLESFVPFARHVSRLGMVNSLAQIVLKIASPGVPDIFQGGERWDLNLVDPDNRRPVDFDRLRRGLDEVEAAASGTLPPVECAARARLWLAHWEDGLIKLHVTTAGLRARRDHPAPFLEGEYRPLEVSGERADHVVAFARIHDDEVVLVVAPRLVASLAREGPPLGLPVWGDTMLHLPDSFRERRFADLLTGTPHEATSHGWSGTLRVAGLLADLPVALLISRPA